MNIVRARLSASGWRNLGVLGMLSMCDARRYGKIAPAVNSCARIHAKVALIIPGSNKVGTYVSVTYDRIRPDPALPASQYAKTNSVHSCGKNHKQNSRVASSFPSTAAPKKPP